MRLFKSSINKKDLEFVLSSNKGDSFLLDAWDYVYIWHGTNSNRMKQAKALDLASRIKNKERQSRAEIVNVPNEGNDMFWKLLGGKTKIKVNK